MARMWMRKWSQQIGQPTWMMLPGMPPEGVLCPKGVCCSKRVVWRPTSLASLQQAQVQKATLMIWKSLSKQVLGGQAKGLKDNGHCNLLGLHRERLNLAIQQTYKNGVHPG